MRIIRLLLIITSLWALAGVAAADKSAARDAYREATRYYDLNDFASALESFKKAYLAYEEPAFLFNIAQCYRQLDRKAEAVRFYRTYLRKVPDAPNRVEVKQLIANLESALAAPGKLPPPPGMAEAERPAPCANGFHGNGRAAGSNCVDAPGGAGGGVGNVGGSDGTTNMNAGGGGGGGAAGRLRLNSLSGAATFDGGSVLNPALADLTSTGTHAATQGVIDIH